MDATPTPSKPPPPTGDGLTITHCPRDDLLYTNCVYYSSLGYELPRGEICYYAITGKKNMEYVMMGLPNGGVHAGMLALCRWQREVIGARLKSSPLVKRYFPSEDLPEARVVSLYLSYRYESCFTMLPPLPVVDEREFVSLIHQRLQRHILTKEQELTFGWKRQDVRCEVTDIVGKSRGDRSINRAIVSPKTTFHLWVSLKSNLQLENVTGTVAM